MFRTISLVFLLILPFISTNDISPNEALTSPSIASLEPGIITEKDVSPNTTINLNNVSETLNETAKNANATFKLVNCNLDFGSKEVEIVNDTQLIKILQTNPNVTSRDIPAQCVLVLFYSKYGTFSSMAAPHFNALPRAFPDIKMVAINAMMYHLFNTQNGIVGIPSLLLFHNGRAVAKFNDSEYTLDLFSKFITRHTGIQAKEKSIVTSADFAGPVSSSPSQDSDIFLVLSWLFVLFCAIYYFTKSTWWRWILETIQNNWRESGAQVEHLHAD